MTPAKDNYCIVGGGMLGLALAWRLSEIGHRVALLEATASGLPCLVNAHPVMQWMIGKGGRAIDMAVAGSLAAQIEELATNHSLRGDLGRLARQHCLANFGKDAVVDQILDYYQQVMGARQFAGVSP